MAGTWFNLSLVILCINIFMYIGAAETGVEIIDIEGDMISQYIVGEFNSSNMLRDASATDLEVNKSVIKAPEKSTVPVVGTFIEVLNSLDIVFDIGVAVLNIAFAPLVLFKIEGIPYIIAFLIAIPLTIMFWLSIIQFFRGAS